MGRETLRSFDDATVLSLSWLLNSLWTTAASCLVLVTWKFYVRRTVKEAVVKHVLHGTIPKYTWKWLRKTMKHVRRSLPQTKLPHVPCKP